MGLVAGAGGVKEVYTNFTKGELGPELQGRIDTPQYKAGAKKITNFIIQKYGGLSFRPGFRFVAEADDVGTPMKYISFDFGLDQSYVLAAQDLAFRPLALGGAVLEENLEILAVSIAEHAVLTVSYHAYEVGDRIYINGSNPAELNGRFGHVLEVIDENNIRTDIDTRDLDTFVSSDGTDRTIPPTPPPPPPPPPPSPPSPPAPPDVGGGGGGGGGWGGGALPGQNNP